jgi:hypothetical protein
MRLSSQFFGAIVQSRVRRKFAFPDFELLARNFAPGFSQPAHENKTGGTRAGDEGGEWLPAVVFIEVFCFAPVTNALLFL